MGGALILGVLLILSTFQEWGKSKKETVEAWDSAQEDAMVRQSLYGDEETLALEQNNKSRSIRITHGTVTPGALLIVPQELDSRLSRNEMAVIFTKKDGQKSLIITYGSGWQIGSISSQIHVNLRRDCEQEDLQSELIKFANER